MFIDGHADILADMTQTQMGLFLEVVSYLLIGKESQGGDGEDGAAEKNQKNAPANLAVK
jgi:hypothetical protein